MFEVNPNLPIAKATIGSESVNSVNARDLHRGLEVGKDFSNWMKDQIDRAQLVRSEDFEVVAQKGENPQGGRPSVEYALTLDAAKNIAMMSATEAGRKVRRYFIEAEKALRANPATLITRVELARMLIQSEEELDAARNMIMDLRPAANYAKAVLMASNGHTATDVAKRLGFTSAMKFNEKMKELGVIFRNSSGHWVPYSKYSGDKYFEIRTAAVTHNSGVKSHPSLTWKEEGIRLACQLLGIIETQLQEVTK